MVTLCAIYPSLFLFGKDRGTGDFLTGVMEAHEKIAWMLGAHVK
jgi:DNA-binding ferritin-like protein